MFFPSFLYLFADKEKPIKFVNCNFAYFKYFLETKY